MQLVSRARRAGVLVSAQDVFEAKTPAGLALAAAVSDSGTEEGPEDGVGPVPLTPVMRRRVERGGGQALAGRLTQWTAVTAPAGLDEQRLTASLQAMIDHHDMLRARLVDQELEVLPIGAVSADGLVTRVDATASLAAEAAEAAGRLDLRAGVTVQAVWFDAGPDREGQLLLVAHHLVVDGVSWRVLLPDLAAAYAAVAAGQDVRLEPVRTSFRGWARSLLAQAGERAAELPQWKQILQEEPLLGRRPLDPSRDRVAGIQRMAFQVPAQLTEALLTTVPGAFNAGVHEVLLAGLAAAVKQRRSEPAVLVDVEGHGRQELTTGMDLSRTVGWFTSMHPVRLDLDRLDAAQIRAGGPAAGEMIKRVKEQLRAVPGDGLGYGVLRYLNAETGPELARLATPQIGFNYLGRFAEGGGKDDWQPVAMGGDTDGDMPASHVLEVTASIQGSELSLSLAWPEDVLEETDVRGLGQDWLNMLEGLATHVARPGAGGHTPSDFPLLDLDQDQIEELEAEFARDDTK
jgi:nonribosomal peptide synthetase CepB